uniref:Unspecific monooxygenase n=1 Tax=Steinernema glaseri TaxID=37863 RepID=A0A1I8AC43_9BILA
MQHIILEEVDYRFELLNKEISKSVDQKVVIDPAPFMSLLIGSVINKLVVGYRYDESNMEEFLMMKRSFNAVLDIFTPFDFLIFSEKTYQLPVFKQRWDKAVAPNYEIRGILERQVNERKADIAAADIAAGHHVLDMINGGDNYTDAYLIEMERRKQNGEDQGSFSECALLANLLDLWIAGTDTTISVMLWGFVYLLHNPEVQEKVRKEVLSITEGNRHVEFTDKLSMPYTNAVITELLRCSCVLNINLFHETTCDTVFEPERYLCAKSKKLEQQVIPFGVGKRSCLGESLAKAELFLILSNFLQKYIISVPDGSPLPSLQQIALDGTLKRTRPYRVQIEEVR